MISLLNAATNHELALSELETELGLAKQTVKSYFNKLLDYCHEQGLTTFSVKANHFKSDLVDYFWNDGVNFTGHDGRTGLFSGEIDFMETRTWTGTNES